MSPAYSLCFCSVSVSSFVLVLCIWLFACQAYCCTARALSFSKILGCFPSLLFIYYTLDTDARINFQCPQMLPSANYSLLYVYTYTISHIPINQRVCTLEHGRAIQKLVNNAILLPPTPLFGRLQLD